MPQHFIVSGAIVCFLLVAIGIAIVRRASIVVLLTTSLIAIMLDGWTRYYVPNADSKSSWRLLTVAVGLLGFVIWLVVWYRFDRSNAKKEPTQHKGP